MVSTGIVRRMDDLGRVVIPKEIRRNLGITENAPLEIFVTVEGGVLFLPYNPNRVEDIKRIKQSILNDCDWYDKPTKKIKQAFDTIEKELKDFGFIE